MIVKMFENHWDE